jgi:hypothetical protein
MCILTIHKVNNKSKWEIKAAKNHNNHLILKIVKTNINKQLRKKQSKSLKKSKNLLWT